MADMMTFPDTVEEFMEEYKLVDTEQVYTNGTELVPIFRMKQWFEHEKAQLSQEGTTKGTTSDLISRQAAIDVTDSEKVSTNPEHFKSSEKFIKFMDDDDIASFGRWQWANGFNTALVASKVQLEKLPSAQPEPQWIPVERELPKESGYYITSNGYNGVGEDFYYDGHFWNADKNAYEVIAWMPKPKAYKPNK